MSPATTNSPEEPSKSPRKATKSAKTRKLKSAIPAAKTQTEKSTLSFPVFDLSESPSSPRPAPEESAPRVDDSDSELASSSEAAVRENPKRKRRRKKGKGGQHNVNQVGFDDASAVSEKAQSTAARALLESSPRQSQSPRPMLDADMLAKLAWKIYLAEVSEEGVALIGDTDAKELSRRCFRLAEIFMEEKTRRN